MYIRKFFYYSVILLFCTACSLERLPAGAVAEVNGEYILLKDIRDRYDVQTIHISALTSPTIEEIEKGYTETLSDMILEVVLEQELAKYDIEVSERDVNNALESVHKDYSEQEFKTMLADRYIDLESWKKQMRARLVEDAFMKKVIYQKVKITEAEIEAYYKKHKNSLYTPEQIKGIVVSSESLSELKKAIALLVAGNSAESVTKKYPTVYIESVTVDSISIPPEFYKEVSKLKPGQFTTTRKVSTEFMSIILQGRSLKKMLTLQEAFPIVEQQLVEEKAVLLYDGVVNDLLKKSSVYIAPEFKKYIYELAKEPVKINKEIEKEENVE